MRLHPKSKRVLGSFLTAAMLLTLFPGPAYADGLLASPSGEIVLLGETNAVTVTTSGEFMEALAQKKPSIIVSGIITIGDETETSGRMKPVMIPGGTTISGTAGSSLNCRCPIQLEGDNVTFTNIELVFESSTALGSVAHREIFLAGHSLIINEVSTYLAGNDGSLGSFGGTESELLPSVYAGGYPGTAVGDNASLTVNASPSCQTMFQAIYMGHDEGISQNVGYDGKAILNLAYSTIVREGVYTHMNSDANITVHGNPSRISISKATKFYGNEHTVLSIDSCEMHQAIISDVENVILENGAYLEPLSGSLKTIQLDANSRLDFSNVINAAITGNFTSLTDSSSDQPAVLILDCEGSLHVTGTVSGTTQLQTNGALRTGITYITAPESSEENSFTLSSADIGNAFYFEYNKGAWTVYNSSVKYIASVEILSAPTAVDLKDIRVENFGFCTDETPAHCEIVWHDTDGNIIPVSYVDNYGFADTYEYATIINTGDWTDESYNSSIDWFNEINLIPVTEKANYN